MSSKSRRSGAGLSLLGGVTLALVAGVAAGAAARGPAQAAPQALRELALDAPLVADSKVAAQKWGAARSQVVVRLKEPHGAAVPRGQQRAQRNRVDQQQAEVLGLVRAVDPSATVLGRTRMVMNALILDVEPAALKALNADTRVLGLDPVVNYTRALDETVPQIGAATLHDLGYTGEGITVAVLDSGIDYTHAAFGGAGNAAAYTAAYGASTADPKNTTRDGLFPTARVVEGFDFVGEAWPNGALAPDDDPIDCGADGLQAGTCAGGHGTHVADIIGGLLGVAPDVDLHAVKVCSAVSNSCSGVGILQGLDYVVDPDGNGDTADRIDVANLSLGSPYGLNYDHAGSIAADNATAAGVMIVASAGNSADKPYVTGTPGAARSALSVAQTEVASAGLQLIELDSSVVMDVEIGGQFQSWAAPLVATLSSDVVYDMTDAGTRLGCSDANGANPWMGTPFVGKIVLVDRGSCAFSLKAANIKAAGGIAALFAMVDASLPFAASYGGGDASIPSYMIRQVDGSAIKAQLLNMPMVTLDPGDVVPTSGTMVGSSSRGPASGLMRYQDYTVYGQLIKPEIGAPGASVSAIAGTGTGTEAFSGTSGAAPMVAGSAALLLDATDKALSPLEVKARLTSTGETEVYNTPAIWGGALAAIQRIGGGEVRVDRALAAQIAVWHEDNYSGALSFGTVEADEVTTISKRVTVKNYGTETAKISVTPEFRFANDEASGAVTIDAPASFTVKPGVMRTMTIRATVDPSKLPAFTASSGSQGANALPLTNSEYDGYLRFEDANNPANSVQMPWHVLPRAAANVSNPRTASVGVPVALDNAGAATAQIDSYSLIGLSNKMKVGDPGQGTPPVDLKALGVRTFPGGCGPGNYALQFAVSSHYRYSHAIVPSQAGILLDSDRDGTPDFQVLNADFTLNTITDGRVLAWVVNLRTGSATANFFADHGFNTSNLVLTICQSQLADPARPPALGGPLAPPALGQPVDAIAVVFDNYFTGNVRDLIDGIVFAPGGERYIGDIDDIPAGASRNLEVFDTGSTVNKSEKGVLLMLDGARTGAKNGNPDNREAHTIRVN